MLIAVFEPQWRVIKMNQAISNDEMTLFRDMARRAFQTEITPYFEEWESDKEMPRSVWNTMGSAGLLCPDIAEEYGGSGFNFDDMSILLEEMGSVRLSGPVFRTAITGVQTLLLSGTEEQKKEILPKIGTGQIKISLAFNEKTGSFDESEISKLTADQVSKTLDKDYEVKTIDVSENFKKLIVR